jgi:hypothetical protein
MFTMPYRQNGAASAAVGTGTTGKMTSDEMGGDSGTAPIARTSVCLPDQSRLTFVSLCSCD